MDKNVRLIAIILAIVMVCVAVMFTVSRCTRERVITNTETIIDSVAVKTLKGEVARLKNELNAKPKTITVTSIEHDTLYTTKNVYVYPVGNKNLKRSYPFNASKDGDSISVNVNTDLYAYVYTDHNNGFYYEDSLRVWLTDVRIKKQPVVIKKKQNTVLYVFGGASFSRYNQNVSGTNIIQTDIQPNVGVGYMKGAIGGYVIGAPNGGGMGISLNLSKLFMDIFE